MFVNLIGCFPRLPPIENGESCVLFPGRRYGQSVLSPYCAIAGKSGVRLFRSVGIKVKSIFVKNKKNLSKINKILPPPDRSSDMENFMCENDKRCVIAGKLLRYFRYPGSVMYFGYTPFVVNLNALYFTCSYTPKEDAPNYKIWCILFGRV